MDEPARASSSASAKASSGARGGCRTVCALECRRDNASSLAPAAVDRAR